MQPTIYCQSAMGTFHMHERPRRKKSGLHNPQGGFTLIEIMITVIIIGILAAIAYPSYNKYVTDARRSDGIAGIMRLASALEKFNGSCGQYTATITAGVPVQPACSGLGLVGPPLGNLSPDSHYLLTIILTPDAATGAFTQYQINAAPLGLQATRDTECATLTLNSIGTKGISGGTKTAAYCWKQ
jgi:type IV pilus assembly protein PilE